VGGAAEPLHLQRTRE